MVIGGYNMITQNNTDSKLSQMQFTFIKEKLEEVNGKIGKLEDQLVRSQENVWTRAEQQKFSDEVSRRFDACTQRGQNLHERLHALETEARPRR